ncbi:MAG: hypothetical protein CL862_02750 [Cyanobium sp. NAT70]|nr:hypothetical protein [Cyanobium sp. NAT70]
MNLSVIDVVGVSPSDAHTISDFIGPTDDLLQRCLCYWSQGCRSTAITEPSAAFFLSLAGQGSMKNLPLPSRKRVETPPG